MICPSCHRDFWALFPCHDDIHRCRACTDAMPPVPVVIKVNASGQSYRVVPKPKRIPQSVDTSQRPYTTRRKRTPAQERERRRRNHLCFKCGAPAQEYSPGNHSVQCEDCNRVQSQKRRENTARKRAKK